MARRADPPLSPHLQIYSWPINMVTSIAHRASGIVLSVGSIFLAVWLVSAALGPAAFASVNGVAAAWYGQVLMFLWSFALFYHLCNGVRHLVWDTGTGFHLDTARTTGFVVIGIAAGLTIVTWIFALAL